MKELLFCSLLVLLFYQLINNSILGSIKSSSSSSSLSSISSQNPSTKYMATYDSLIIKSGGKVTSQMANTFEFYETVYLLKEAELQLVNAVNTSTQQQKTIVNEESMSEELFEQLVHEKIVRLVSSFSEIEQILKRQQQSSHSAAIHRFQLLRSDSEFQKSPEKSENNKLSFSQVNFKLNSSTATNLNNNPRISQQVRKQQILNSPNLPLLKEILSDDFPAQMFFNKRVYIRQFPKDVLTWLNLKCSESYQSQYQLELGSEKSTCQVMVDSRFMVNVERIKISEFEWIEEHLNLGSISQENIDSQKMTLQEGSETKTESKNTANQPSNLNDSKTTEKQISTEEENLSDSVASSSQEAVQAVDTEYQATDGGLFLEDQGFADPQGADQTFEDIVYGHQEANVESEPQNQVQTEQFDRQDSYNQEQRGIQEQIGVDPNQSTTGETVGQLLEADQQKEQSEVESNFTSSNEQFKSTSGRVESVQIPKQDSLGQTSIEKRSHNEQNTTNSITQSQDSVAFLKETQQQQISTIIPNTEQVQNIDETQKLEQQPQEAINSEQVNTNSIEERQDKQDEQHEVQKKNSPLEQPTQIEFEKAEYPSNQQSDQNDNQEQLQQGSITETDQQKISTETIAEQSLHNTQTTQPVPAKNIEQSNFSSHQFSQEQSLELPLPEKTNEHDLQASGQSELQTPSIIPETVDKETPQEADLQEAHGLDGVQVQTPLQSEQLFQLSQRDNSSALHQIISESEKLQKPPLVPQNIAPDQDGHDIDSLNEIQGASDASKQATATDQQENTPNPNSQLLNEEKQTENPTQNTSSQQVIEPQPIQSIESKSQVEPIVSPEIASHNVPSIQTSQEVQESLNTVKEKGENSNTSDQESDFKSPESQNVKYTQEREQDITQKFKSQKEQTTLDHSSKPQSDQQNKSFDQTPQNSVSHEAQVNEPRSLYQELMEKALNNNQKLLSSTAQKEDEQIQGDQDNSQALQQNAFFEKYSDQQSLFPESNNQEKVQDLVQQPEGDSTEIPKPTPDPASVITKTGNHKHFKSSNKKRSFKSIPKRKGQ